ncbi:MAG: FAD-binding oxidoreductase, partial [Rhodospirillaceae bacterium]|nr:FAD-binding oxidoreductase [Rhodospirillaceae bacterium]
WGYRRVETLGVVASTRRDVSGYRKLPSPDWLADEAAVHGRLGTPASTAQIDPAAFTNAMMSAAIDGGATLIEGCVEGMAFSPGGNEVTGAIVDGATLWSDAVVIAMGPWSMLACQWLPLGPTHGLKGHSLVFDYTPSPESLFVELETDDGEISSPEINPRPDGTTYVCGLSGHDALPMDPADVVPEAGASEKLRRMTSHVSPELGASRVLTAQSCYRPVTADGLPQIGAVPGVAGAYVATGHSVWGMLNGPATGEAMAELITEGAAKTVNLAPFDPARLRL